MLEHVKDILVEAKENNYAIGAFNTTNLETTQAILAAAKEKKSPVIIQVTEKTMNYAGGRNIFQIIKNTAEYYYPEISVGIHLDHGKSFDVIQRAIEIGFTSIMYDGSREKYEDNLMTTKRIAEFCHKKNINIQAELGNVPYLKEIGIAGVDWDKYMTNPEQAEKFVIETNIDALAVAVGNAHDFAKERSEPDFDRLENINQRLDIPLIMHGASDWEKDNIDGAIERGVSCFNVDTASRVAFVTSLVKTISEAKELSYDIRTHLGKARKAIKETVMHKMDIFRSAGKIDD